MRLYQRMGSESQARARCILKWNGRLERRSQAEVREAAVRKPKGASEEFNASPARKQGFCSTPSHRVRVETPIALELQMVK